MSVISLLTARSSRDLRAVSETNVIAHNKTLQFSCYYYYNYYSSVPVKCMKMS